MAQIQHKTYSQTPIQLENHQMATLYTGNPHPEGGLNKENYEAPSYPTPLNLKIKLDGCTLVMSQAPLIKDTLRSYLGYMLRDLPEEMTKDLKKAYLGRELRDNYTAHDRELDWDATFEKLALADGSLIVLE
jgi:hypothetical protein